MPLLRIPGLIDAHVHLREPGATHKEDFYTGSRAAVAGGFTFILDMPNNAVPVLTKEFLEEKIVLAKQKAICDVGFYFGTNGKNTEEFSKVIDMPEVFGLKVYCNHTTGEMLVEDGNLLDKIFSFWQSDKPILVHAEGEQLKTALGLAKKHGRRLHVCHVSQKMEVELVRNKKKEGVEITAGVTPHHLFFYQIPNREKLGNFGIIKPAIKTKEDEDALWQGLKDGTIDIVETDHAPHTREEKEKDPPAFGMPGLETAVGLLFRAAKEKKIKEKDIEKFLYENPKAIFNIPDQPDTYMELDPDLAYTVEGPYETKCGWSAFESMILYGKPRTVVIRGKKILAEGKIVV